MTTAMTATAWRFSAVVFFVMVTMVTTAAAKEWEVKEIKFGEEKKIMIRYMYTGLLSIAFYSRYAISRNCVIKNNNVVKSEEEEEKKFSLYFFLTYDGYYFYGLL